MQQALGSISSTKNKTKEKAGMIVIKVILILRKVFVNINMYNWALGFFPF
jgi:hypothetical protein